MANDNWMLKAVLSAVDRMSPTLKAVANQAKTTRKYLGDVGTSAAKLGTSFGLPVAALSGILGGFSVAAIKSAVVSFTELSEEIIKGSLKAGMTTAEWQKMSYVGMQAGVSAEALGMSVGMLNRKIGDAASGKNKATAGLFKQLGINVRDANGQLRSGVELLPQLADAFSRNTNPVVRARMGMALFGKQWQEIAPLLAEGGEGIEKSLQRFGMLKGVISEGDLRAGKEMGDLFNDLGIVLKGFQGAIARELVPVLTPMIEQFVQWGAANKKLIGQQVKTVVQDFVKFIKEVDWLKVAQGAMSVASAIGKMLVFFAENKVALIALVALLNVSTIQSVVALGGSILRLATYLAGPLMTALRFVWALFAANPIGLVIVAIAALAGVIYANWDNIVSYVSGAWERIKSVFDVGFFSGMFQIWLEGWQAFGNAILGIIKTVIPDFLLPDSFKNFNFSFASDRAAGLTGGGPSLVNGGAGRVDGSVKVDFSNLPPGARVEQVSSGGNMPLNIMAGYNSDALGLGM